ncbi:FAD-dependent oxidoreductase [Mobilibacterium timonense]|uniref:FAD-dependent oxidoreductase n=1 Tax=Mobilibacterium timonense TaxID=1871012 RepID=UPI002356CFFC|nr:FAD-dependent oxidoreductase [Mobilibacterium timonense]
MNSMNSKSKKVVIIGGVAGGAACAARLRRLDERAEIVILEKGPYISFANCGLPYYLGGTVAGRESLLVQSPEGMKSKFNIDVRINSAATSIDRNTRTVTVQTKDGTTYTESYDKLVMSTGSSPVKPPIPGIDSPRIHTLWSIPDADEVYETLKKSRTAAVIGGGFVGLEVVENLKKAGLKVVLIEAADQVMAPLDPEMAEMIHQEIKNSGTELILSDGVDRFEEKDDHLDIVLKSGRVVAADTVVLSIGVKPNSQLAKDAGLELNERGYVKVNEHMETSDPDIYAAGDIVETYSIITGDRQPAPLASPAAKEGRIIADRIAGRDSKYAGFNGTSIARAFHMAAASTGLNEKELKRRGAEKGKDYETVVLTQNSHVGFYPGSAPMLIKLIFKIPYGKVLGAQIVGADGADKRIDVISTVIRFGGTVEDLKNLELAYAPPFSAAKDPVNMAGFVAENFLTGLVRFSGYEMPEDAVVLDVREDPELLAYSIPGARHIPLTQLRDRIGELDVNQHYVAMCSVGVRSYTAARILMQSGFSNVEVFPGGTNLYRALESRSGQESDGSCVPGAEITGLFQEKEGDAGAGDPVPAVKLNCCGMQCPGPLMKVNDMVKTMEDGKKLAVTASDPGFVRDIRAWARKTGNTVISSGEKDDGYYAVIQKGLAGGTGGELSFGAPAAAAPAAPAPGTAGAPAAKDGQTIIVFSGDFDKVMAAFIIANGAAAMGKKVTMFFTFWGLTALLKPDKTVKKSGMEKMFGAMLPRGVDELGLSRMNMGGMGGKMMKKIMAEKNVNSLDQLIKEAVRQGVTMMACTMSMDVMGIKKEELIDGVELAGVGTYLGAAEDASSNLFI